MPFRLAAGIEFMHYDICDPSIRCLADKIGATIFEIEQGRGKICRVLAYTQKDAERLAADHTERGAAPLDDSMMSFDF